MKIINILSMSIALVLTTRIVGMMPSSGSVNASSVEHNAHTATKAFNRLLGIHDEDIRREVNAFFNEKFAAYNKRESLSEPLLEEGIGDSWPRILTIIRNSDKEAATRLFIALSACASRKIGAKDYLMSVGYLLAGIGNLAGVAAIATNLLLNVVTGL